jgi:adenine-specific DNA-methyltransferase
MSFASRSLFNDDLSYGTEERRVGKQTTSAPEHHPTTAVPAGLLQPLIPAHAALANDRAERFVKALHPHIGTPYYDAEGFILYNRDCSEVMSAMATAGEHVELTVTSPPYNIGKAYETNLPLAEYIEWCARWARQVRDVTHQNGTFWLNVGYLAVEGKGKAVPIAYLLWDRVDMYLQQEVVWHYGAGISTKRSFAPRNEKWLFYTRSTDAYTFNLDDVRDPDVKYPNQKKNGKFRCNPLGKNPSDVWSIPKVTTGANRSSKERTDHPAQFPLAVVDRIVKVSSNYAEVVLDPFSGSGSTGIAAVGNGRVYVGCEVREDYCDTTVERHQRLLAMRSAPLTQAELSLL